MRRAFHPLVVRLLVTASLIAGAAPSARAQGTDDRVYNITDVTHPPKLSSQSQAARLVQESYPEELKRRGVGGMVEVRFVVDEKGHVDPTSVQVLDATQTSLGDAAKKVVVRLDFAPGKLNGTNVKTKVVLPIIYKAQ